MKLRHGIYESLSLRIFIAVLFVFFAWNTTSAEAAPEPGTVTIVLAGEPPNLDPGDSTKSLTSQVLKQNIVETLTEMNPADSSIMPRLALSWRQIDANTWQFSLRKGVKFHDGEDFNAEAVVSNIKRLYDKRVLSNVRDKFFSSFKLEGKPLDSYTVELRTDKLQPLLPTLMSILTMCSPNTPLDKLTRNPTGTGPYRFVRWDAGTQVILERFDGYWGKQPQVKKAIYVWRGEPAVRAQMVLIDEADLAPNIAKQDANRPDMDNSYLNAETFILRIGGDWDPPLNDRRFRMALNYAVNRDAIRGSILSKDVIPACQLVGPGIFGFNPDLKPWPYDRQKAKQLLDEARRDGVPVDREILMVGRIAHFPGAEELMEAVMTMFKDVGFNVKLKMLEAGATRPYDGKPYPPGPYIFQKQHDNSSGDAAFTVFYNYHCKGINSTMCDKTVDELIEKAQVAIGEERKNLWRAAFKRIYEEVVPNVFLFHMVAYARIGKRINFRPSLATNNEIQLAQITFR